MLQHKLLANQVAVVDGQYNLTWIFDITDECDLEFYKKKGKRDEHGNLILDLPDLAALKGWQPENAMKIIEEKVKEINVPEILPPDGDIKQLSPPKFENCTKQQLEEYLSIYGGYKAYLETQLSYIASKREIYSSSFEEGLTRMMYSLSKDREKKVIKDALRGESLVLNPRLKRIRQDLIEVEALYNRILGLKDAYKSMYDTVSRVIAIRLSSKDEV